MLQNIFLRYLTAKTSHIIISLALTIFTIQFSFAGEHDHHKIPSKKNYTVAYPTIKLTDISIVDTDNNSVKLTTELDQGPVIINFIFTSCTAICPVLSSTFSQVQKRFDEINVKNIKLVSFSIDPERDTPSSFKKIFREI